MSIKVISRIIALIMLIVAAVFFVYAINHPTASFPWSNTVTYSIYSIYVLIMAVMFIAPFKKRKISSGFIK